MSKKIEDAIGSTLKGDAQRNALDLIAHIRAGETSKHFSIKNHNETGESVWNGWNVSNLGYIIINGLDDFPGPWTIWMEADGLGEHLEAPVDEDIKEFAWFHVSPCGSCGGECTPGNSATVFGRVFENTCKSNLIFINPNAKTVDYMKKIIDVRANDISKK